MYEKMNLGKGFVGGFWMEMPNDCVESVGGNSNWQEILSDGSAYLRPVEVQNPNNMFHDFNGSVEESLLPGFGNGGPNQIDEPLSMDDSSWEQLLSLMTAPSAAPENFMAYKNHVPLPNSGNNRSSLPQMSAASRSNLMQHNAYPQESSYQMQQHNFSSSAVLSQSNYASINRQSNSFPYTMQDEYPVCYNPRYNLNNTHVAASSSIITSSSQFAPLTPQAVNRNHLYSGETNLCLDQNLNQYKVMHGDLMASRITQSSHFAPATPQPAKAADSYQYPATQSLYLDQIQKQDKLQKDIVPDFIEIESTSLECQEVLDNILDSSSTAIGTSFKERNDSETEENQNIDLNQTPSLKAPRRKKHRPKVIRENKPPRNQKPAKEKVGPDGIPVPKRKYVRKNKSDSIKTPQQDVGEKTNDSAAEPTSNSCRKSLHFELEDEFSNRTKQVHQKNIFQDILAQEARFSQQRNAQIQENKEGGSNISLHPSIHQLQRVDTNQCNQHMLGTHPVIRDGITDKSYMSTSQADKGANVLSEKIANGYHHPFYAGVGQTLQKITVQEELERTRQTIEEIQRRRVSEYIQSRGSKRDYLHASSGISTNTTSSQLCEQEIFRNQHARTNSRLDQCYPGTQKRKRIENISHTANSRVQCATRFADNRSQQVQLNGYHVNHFLEVNGGLNNPYSRGNTCGVSNPFPASGCTSVLRQPIPSEASMGQEMLALNSVSALAYPNVQNQMSRVHSRTQSLVTETTNKSSHAIVPINKHNGASNLRKPVADKTGKHLKQKKNVSVDDITEQLKCLNLNSTKNEMVKDEHKALVLYKGGGTLVPYEGFDYLKRKKPRPKVDLDPETNRIWNLLMGKEVNDNEKQTDEQKTKWWEEQRKVFHGRADSFIARMHLVQGDRRFSPWKGSVVDSVIGVFLTQNVTDHLSSSAFMSLAARFPPQSIRGDIASGINKPDALVEESQICIVEINEKMQENEKFKEQVNHNRIPNKPPEQRNEKHSTLEYIQRPVRENVQNVDELVSSQDSTESSTVLVNETVQPLYISGLTADCQTNGCSSISRYSTMSFIIEEMENHARFPNSRTQDSGILYNNTSIDGLLQAQNEEAGEQEKLDDTCPFDLNRPQLPSPVSSNSCQLPATGGFVLSDTEGCNTLSSQHYTSLQSTAVSKDTGVTSIGTEQEHEKTWPTELLTGNTVQNYHHQSSCCDNQQDRAMSTQLGRQSENGLFHQQSNMIEDATASNHPREASSNQKSISAVEEPTMTKTNVSKEKGRKVDGVKKTTIDWDCLRRQVKSHVEHRERSQNAIDSIDYEALQQADVSKISDTIRERGMNNMLAERIKEFLDRLLRDHGSMDLEWLRHVPPDKAKDYLLSIRGLGLKSVECIRLLTLHQHAFPVDTNVGRIAVRLGWVPLQPLPESLQLHLLEMYPILESVQKYLYPRLCNLDQRTLYELHYQLITFGKVFCTKTKPNCNACPMRGECRHFASAFASSRLALPGPEEKSIVTSNSPIETSRDTTFGVSPLPLPFLQDAKPEETTLANRTCEPIVEEPTSPEPESTDITEIFDIEEAFYEDPDEIPTIRLNVEEFTQNLQIFMQEGDMSKALVAFDPQVASIPTPKLKNVSRLRTEHQVYQLPDSHPLLKELDKREPDDPSPYLLAIWTPGETANSIHPPEGICNFRESGQLCSEKACSTCNSVKESDAQTVRGTILIPCRTAMRGSFPLNGTYFQVNEVFADHESSLNPIDVPREWIWNLPRSTVYFGTSVSAIFRGMSTEEIQHCFWRGFVCVRGFDQMRRIPRPLMARLHFSASKQMREADKRSKKGQNN